MRYLAGIIGLLFLSVSCVPLRIAPNIEDHKIEVAKKFYRKLPNQNAYIFEDRGGDYHFFNFMDNRYYLRGEEAHKMIPVVIGEKSCFLSFYEVLKPDKWLNFIPALLNSEDGVVEEREDHWYLALLVTNAVGEDCLAPDYKAREEVVVFLDELKAAYQGHIAASR